MHLSDLQPLDKVLLRSHGWENPDRMVNADQPNTLSGAQAKGITTGGLQEFVRPYLNRGGLA